MTAIPNLFRVALYGPVDPLPPSARRFLITGPSGAGKSTLRAVVGESLHVPSVDIDSFYHGPNWTMRATFEHDVDQFTSGPSWAIEWLYSQMKPLLLSRADVLVWLDHNRWTVAQRVVRRTVRRRLRNESLWNGNVEPPLRTFLTNPDHIIRWSWRTHSQRGKEALVVADSDESPFVVRLCGQSEVDAWIRGPLTALASATTD